MYLALSLERLRRTTRVGHLLKSGIDLHALSAAALALHLFSSQVLLSFTMQLTFILIELVLLWNGTRWMVNLKLSGAGWTQGSLGFLPRRRKLKVVMGKPIEVGVLEQLTFQVSLIVWNILIFIFRMLLF